MPDTSQPRLLSFTLDGWTALGGQVSVFLEDKVGVLVGRNGAGKSAILEGFDAISSWATGKTNRVRIFESDSIPNILDIVILTPTQRRLRYKYEVISLPNSTDDSDIDDSTSDSLEESQFSWNEHCQYIDGDKEDLWTTETGVTTFGNGDTPSILGSTNSLRQLHLPKNSRLKLPEEMQWVHTVLRGVRFLGRATVRQTFRRRPSLLKVSSKGIPYSSFGLADSLARKILRRIDTGELHELESVCQRIGLGSKITVQKFVLSEDPREKIEGEREEYVNPFTYLNSFSNSNRILIKSFHASKP